MENSPFTVSVSIVPPAARLKVNGNVVAGVENEVRGDILSDAGNATAQMLYHHMSRREWDCLSRHR